jgi:hypothetical protein
MRTKPTLTFAASAFIVTAVLFTAAMVVAHSLSIPDPEARFLPSAARDLPNGTDADGVELANDNRSGQTLVPDEPMPEVTAVPEPPSTADAAQVPNEGASAVSASGDTVANAGSPGAFTLSTGGTPSTPGPPKYTGPGWPSWGGSPAPTAPPSRDPTPAPSEPQPSEPQPSESESEEEEEEEESSEPPSEPIPGDEPVPSEPAASEDATE